MDRLPQHLAFPPTTGQRALVLADGEHYPAAVADTIAKLREVGWDPRLVCLLGGTEKLREEPDYGVPHVAGDSMLGALRAALGRGGADVVVDLADEPVLTFEQRTTAIGVIAAHGLRYLGADLVVEPPRYESVAVPSLAIIGTGKRIGKTAVSAHVARAADAALGGGGEVVVVAMGRGGPAEPVVVERTGGAVTVERLLEISRGGSHAASDYLEDAVLTGLTTIGCRRVGGGVLGVPVQSNVAAGARIAEQLRPRLAIFEGSGSCIPPVATDRTLLLASTARPQDLVSGFGPYRVERADMLLVVGDDRDGARQLCAAAGELRPGLPTFGVSLVPTPVRRVDGRRVAAFTTAPAHVAPVVERSLEQAGAGDVVLVSHALARRDELREDIARAAGAGADTFVVEIKAAAVDVVAEAAEQRGIEVVWMDNLPVAHDPELDLDGALASLARQAAEHGTTR